jgi:hypothetical protein
MIADTETPPQVRLSAARDILDRAGFVAPKRAELVITGSKPLREMTRAELEAFVAAPEVIDGEAVEIEPDVPALPAPA